MIDEQLQDWIDRSLEEIATEEESKALENRLRSDAQARDHYLNEVNLHASLRRRFSAEGEVPSMAILPDTKRSKLKLSFAIAACLAVLVFGAIAFFDSTPKAIATITQVVGAYDGDEVVFAADASVSSGPLVVSRGLIRLDFANGARVSVEGPAELEIVNEMRLNLQRGVVTATIPESAIGFVVDTAAAHVVDLGTSFGVSVSDEGLTNVCVFEGEVEVSSAAGNRVDEATHLLKEGEAVRASEASGSIDSVAYEPSRFERAWPVNTGVLQTTGAIRFVSPGPDFHPGNYEDNEHIVVFPERRSFAPKESVPVDMIDPGEFAKSHAKMPNREKPTLPADRRLTSYLLQLNAYPEGKNPNRRRSVRGQITFAKPIAGVITVDRLLKKSEAIFGIPNVAYPSARMIEPRPEGDERKGFDRLILAADRRTLFIELQENPGHLDQVRVLVEAE